ncbi:hypothetical protein [Sinorhizobium saheli]|uniref:Uncharacterized protein n=1 Tax=Sinorhizobium saheli TaxID=36856 RepID=A0A178XWU7_SINSA|nr:hypothetical protein [Sinorhizobium saheli]MQW86385.1 hypothetical protein [Sinorhizobium saheli]OAP39687.1 hypothetical protein ATB98_05050 [Sinorhizobium saheli]
MQNESEQLSKTLAWTCGMILQSGPDDLRRIGLAYRQAQDLVARIAKDDGDARPRIVACFERSDYYRAENDVACVGWILTAIQERVNERNLPDWRTLRKILDKTVRLLPRSKASVH